MDQAPKVSVTIITLNEEVNIGRAIDSVKWADEILVIDSGSTDKTTEIAAKKGGRVIKQPWLGYGQQKNFAQDNARNEWVLNIDADEEVPPELAEEIIKALSKHGNTVKGYRIPRKTRYLGRWIDHGGWYPNYLVRLANRKHARWSEPEVHEELVVDGAVEDFTSDLHHFSFLTIEEQVCTNLRFSRLGSKELLKKGIGPSVLLLLIKPLGKFIETYLVKRGFLDGLPGFIISVNAAHSMFLKYAYLIEAELKKNENSDN